MSGGGRVKKEQNAWNQQAKADHAELAKVDPLEQKIRDQNMATLNWMDSSGKDVRDLKAIEPFIQIGQAAKDRANRERFGTGALQLASDGGTGHALKLKELRQQEDAQNFGVGLENATQMALAEAKGSVMPLASLSLSRKQAQAGQSANMANMWLSKKTKNFWDYMMEGTQMASNIGGAMMGFG